MRIDKYLSNAGYGSRSEVKTLIKEGRISINGEICSDPSKKIPVNTNICVDGKLATSKPVSTIMLNKPKGYISANESEGGYPSVLELIQPPHPNYKIAGRLDVDTTGLMILSTQGNLVHSIISPSKAVSKFYKVEVVNFVSGKIQPFFEGMVLASDFETKPVTYFRVLCEEKGVYTICLGITEGKFHQVKRMFQHIQAEVLELERIAIGSLRLDSSLLSGEYRELTETDIQLIFCEPTNINPFVC